MPYQYLLYFMYNVCTETCLDFEISLVYMVQFSSGWSYGEQICEISKSHPLLKPYKGLSEKVVSMQLFLSVLFRHQPDVFSDMAD